MTTLYCMSYVLFLGVCFCFRRWLPFAVWLALCFRCLPFALDNDYPLLYVLRSVFGVSLYGLGVCRLL